MLKKLSKYIENKCSHCSSSAQAMLKHFDQFLSGKHAYRKGNIKGNQQAA